MSGNHEGMVGMPRCLEALEKTTAIGPVAQKKRKKGKRWRLNL